MIKGLIQQEDPTVINTYTPKTKSPKYIKQILINLKGEIDSNTITGGSFHTLFPIMNISSRQKINRETEELSNAIDQMNLTDM